MGVLLQGFYKKDRTMPSLLPRMAMRAYLGGGIIWLPRPTISVRQDSPRFGYLPYSKLRREQVLALMATASSTTMTPGRGNRKAPRPRDSARASNCSDVWLCCVPMAWTSIWTWLSTRGLATPRRSSSDIQARMALPISGDFLRTRPTSSRKFPETRIWAVRWWMIFRSAGACPHRWATAPLCIRQSHRGFRLVNPHVRCAGLPHR